MKRKRVTIRDVAKLAGVSHQTVSRVLNKPEEVSADTRKSVEEAIAALDYRPNASARSLAAGHTNTIACFAPNLLDFTFAGLIEGAELKAREHGYFVMAVSAPDAEEFSKTLKQLYESRRIDGVVVINPFIDERADYLPKNFPTVYVGDESNNDEVGWVKLDDVNAGKMAAKHLLDLARSYRWLRSGFNGRRYSLEPRFDRNRRLVRNFCLSCRKQSFARKERILRCSLPK